MNYKVTLIIVIVLLFTVLTSHVTFAQSIAVRWNTPSLLTPAQASDVLYRQADGQSVAAAELFEAQKYLRTDGSASLGGPVVTDMLAKLLDHRIGYTGGTVRIRSLVPVLQWLESTVTTINVRLRGESVQLATLNEDPNLAAVVLYHQTIFQDWKLCGSTPCSTTVAGAVRSQIGYDLVIPLDANVPAVAQSSELVLATGLVGYVHTQSFPDAVNWRHLGVACDPIPSQIIFPSAPSTARPTMQFRYTADRTEGARTNQAFCAFFSVPSSSSSVFSYLNANYLATAPSGAARSAVKNNPLEFRLFQ
ncbi:MAG: hypothetical protein ACREQQ_00330 [Candidatus Binatia bacterium]